LHNHSDVAAGSSDITVADRVLGVCILIAGISMVVAARTSATILPAFSLVALGAAYFERTRLQGVAPVDVQTWLVTAFVGLAVLSAAWSPDPAATIKHTAIFLLFLIQWQLLRTWLESQPPRRIRHLSFWFTVAVAIGLAILTIEVWAHQYIRRLVIENFDFLTPPTLNKHYRIDAEGNVEISGFELNRSIATVNMLLWPTLLCAASLWTGRLRLAMSVAIAAGVALATFGANHETSKISLVAGFFVFAIACFRPRASAVLLAVVWATLILAIVPASLIAYKQLDLDESSWLQHSAQRRIVIWNDVGEQVKLAPWLGFGARTAYVLSEEGAKRLNKGVKETRALARHAHNVYLQTWFELGFAGAFLMLVAGLSIIWAATRVVEPAQPFALATFAVFVSEIGSSWEIWQRWFFALFVLTAVFTVLGVRSMMLKSPSRAVP
jgi:O-antigen ligase